MAANGSLSWLLRPSAKGQGRQGKELWTHLYMERVKTREKAKKWKMLRRKKEQEEEDKEKNEKKEEQKGKKKKRKKKK